MNLVHSTSQTERSPGKQRKFSYSGLLVGTGTQTVSWPAISMGYMTPWPPGESLIYQPSGALAGASADFTAQEQGTLLLKAT